VTDVLGRGQPRVRPPDHVVDVDGARLPLDAEHLVRVDAGTAGTLTSGPDGLRVLCVGGVPGAAYEPPDWSSAAAAIDGS
jgi:hypothetical protein